MPKSGKATYHAILDAANRIVHEQGVEHLTLELTAREAGISKGGLLYHFPSKEALIKGMIQYYLERFSKDFKTAAEKEGPDTPGRWTRSYLYTTYNDNQGSPRMSSGLLAAIATNPALLSPVQRTFAEWVRLLEQDGIDPVQAMIVRLAIDGLWLVELFGLAAPDQEQHEKVLQALAEMIEKQANRQAGHHEIPEQGDEQQRQE